MDGSGVIATVVGDHAFAEVALGPLRGNLHHPVISTVGVVHLSIYSQGAGLGEQNGRVLRLALLKGSEDADPIGNGCGPAKKCAEEVGSRCGAASARTG